MRVWFGLASLVAACSFTPSGSGVDASGNDPDGTSSLIDADPTQPDAPLSPDAPPCAATCDGDVLTTCAPAGTVTCAAGCTETGGGRCLVFQPSNGVPPDFATGAAATLTVPSDRIYVFDTDDGSVTSYNTSHGDAQSVRAVGIGVVSMIKFETRTQSNAPELAIWGLTSLTQPAGTGKIAFRGSRAAVLLASGPIELHGLVDASGGQTDAGEDCRECAGPGGGAGATKTTAAGGCAPGGNGNYSSNAWETGAAGGGMATQGASGATSLIPGGSPSSISTCSGVTLEPLGGGGGGGRAAMNGTAGGDAVGGGGGGGLQLTSLDKILIDGASAEVYVGGMGGEGSAAVYGGGGGGAGGAILLEAPAITLGNGAAIAANGGGGGAGHDANPGAYGRSDTTAAAGGAGSGGVGGNNGSGGAGGVTSNAAAVTGRPGNGTGGQDGTGGGGGAAGRIRLNTRVGSVPTTTGAVVSPAPSTGTRAAQ